MHYPLKFMQNVENDFVVEVPDLPGCNVNANSIEEGFVKIKQAIVSHLMILAEYGEAIPNASAIDKYSQKQSGVIWAVIDIDITPYLGKSHKINVTLPELLIKQIDDRVNKSEDYKSRSGFIATACISELRKNN